MTPALQRGKHCRREDEQDGTRFLDAWERLRRAMSGHAFVRVGLADAGSRAPSSEAFLGIEGEHPD